MLEVFEEAVTVVMAGPVELVVEAKVVVLPVKGRTKMAVTRIAPARAVAARSQ